MQTFLENILPPLLSFLAAMAVAVPSILQIRSIIKKMQAEATKTTSEAHKEDADATAKIQAAASGLVKDLQSFYNEKVSSLEVEIKEVRADLYNERETRKVIERDLNKEKALRKAMELEMEKEIQQLNSKLDRLVKLLSDVIQGANTLHAQVVSLKGTPAYIPPKPEIVFDANKK